jgi:hypothetical protein
MFDDHKGAFVFERDADFAKEIVCGFADHLVGGWTSALDA